MPSSRGSSPPRDWTRVSCISCTAGGFFTIEPLGQPRNPHIESAIKQNWLPHLWLQVTLAGSRELERWFLQGSTHPVLNDIQVQLLLFSSLSVAVLTPYFIIRICCSFNLSISTVSPNFSVSSLRHD